MYASLQHSATKFPFSSWKGFPAFLLKICFLMDSKSLAAVCCLGWKHFHMELSVPPLCAVCGQGHRARGHTPCPPCLPVRSHGVQGHGRTPELSAPVQQRCLPQLQERLSPAPSPVTGSSKTPRVQRHFMLTEHFPARNLRLNKLESTLTRKQKMEGEELALSCTARSWCTLENSQVRCTSNPHWPHFPVGPGLCLLATLWISVC